MNRYKIFTAKGEVFLVDAEEVYLHEGAAVFANGSREHQRDIIEIYPLNSVLSITKVGSLTSGGVNESD